MQTEKNNESTLEEKIDYFLERFVWSEAMYEKSDDKLHHFTALNLFDQQTFIGRRMYLAGSDNPEQNEEFIKNLKDFLKEGIYILLDNLEKDKNDD